MATLVVLGLSLSGPRGLPGPIAGAGPSPGSDPGRYGSYLASRPRAAELEAVELMLDLCRETGCPVHIVHVSAADTLERLRRARDAGLPVTAETCPHYLTFAAEEILDGATAWKCAPPIRERSNRERLWGGLADGTLDLVASDHSPAPPELKCLDTGDFARAGNVRGWARVVSDGRHWKVGSLKEGLVALAAAGAGGRALAASDEFFAPRPNLIAAGSAVFFEGKYTGRGNWMDGWETRRRRGP